MRKRIFPRIVWIILLNCVVFVLLVMMQFTRRGNFSQRIGDMVVNGRYDLTDTVGPSVTGARKLSGEGLTVFFGGLEFRFDAGFYLIDSEGRRQNAFPEYITVTDNRAAFILPGGAGLSFGIYEETEETLPELRISGNFTNTVSSIEIPFKSQRSSLIRDSGTETMTISYNGSRYQFSHSPHGLEAGQLILSAAVPAVSYGAIADKKEIELADLVIPPTQTAEAFSTILSEWINYQFNLWGRSMTADNPRTNEDTVVAWCGEALRQGTYRRAIAAVPVSFSSHPQRSWESAVYQFDRKIGVWAEQISAFGRHEREMNSRISRLLTDRNLSLFAEPHLIEFLAIRSNGYLIDELLTFAQEMAPGTITLPIGPGILECYTDMVNWRPNEANPFAPLAVQVCRLAADGLYKADEQLFVQSGGMIDIAFNLRLGKALREWGEQSGNDDWAGLGRSLVLSVISLAGESTSVPARLVPGEDETLTESDERISTAELYRLLGYGEYRPHAAATGTNGIWAWTAASSISVTQNENAMDISVRFPVGETHYVLIRNVRPFVLLRIYGQDWRRAYDFESYYNSSGWYYFDREQVLVLKVSHRSNTENIRLYFTPPRPSDPAVQAPSAAPQAVPPAQGQQAAAAPQQ